MNSKKPRWLKYLALPFLLGAGALLIPGADYEYQPREPAPASFEEFLENTRPSHPVRPGNEATLIRHGTEKTEYAIFYIHGFGASKGEGELVMNQVARAMQANIFYIRLPGHGTNKEDLQAQTAEDYLDGVERAFRAMPLIGEKIIVVGTSFGGLLATHLAATYPEQVEALILTSPFFEFKPLDARVMGFAPLRPIMNLAMGRRLRITRKNPDEPPGPDDPRGPGYTDYWYNEKYTGSYLPVAELRDRIVERDTFARMTMPVLLLYYYKDEENQDPSAMVRAMLDRFAQMGRSPSPLGPQTAHPLNRAVAVPGGAHVMLSEHVKSDHETPRQEMEAFLNDVRAMAAGPAEAGIAD